MQSVSIWLVANYPLIIRYRYSIARRLWFHRQSVHCDITICCCCIHYTISRDSFRSCLTKKKDKIGTMRSSGIFLLVSILTINLITFYCNHFITPMMQEFKMWFNAYLFLAYLFLNIYDCIPVFLYDCIRSFV